MKVVLDIKDNKADFILDWLKQFAFVTVEPVKSKGYYPDEFRVELDRRYQEYITGETKPVSAAESKSRIDKILKKAD